VFGAINCNVCARTRVARACVRLHASNNVVLSKGAVPLAHWRVCSLSWFIAGQGRHWSIEACVHVCGSPVPRVSTAAHDQYLLYHNGGCLRSAPAAVLYTPFSRPHRHTTCRHTFVTVLILYLLGNRISAQDIILHARLRVTHALGACMI
jgi:hypothetical protein